MRTDPLIETEEQKQLKQERKERILKKVAIAVAFASVFYFWVKLVFL